jgi:two-component system, LytTR family, response regulator
MKLNKKYTYLIVEDSIDACEGIILRMSEYDKWIGIDYVNGINSAKEVVFSKKPELLFMDWDVIGGSTYELLELIENDVTYNPFIIYFTAFQNDHPEIPTTIHNRFNVDIYLTKPIWKEFSENLENYLNRAIKKCNATNANYLLKTEDGQHVKISLNDIVCATVFDGVKRTKRIILKDGQELICKLSLDDIEALISNIGIETIRPNKRYSILNPIYIKSYKRPNIFLKNLTQFLEVSQDNIIEFEKVYLKI